jgi:multiple sugar transport system permease protein
VPPAKRFVGGTGTTSASLFSPLNGSRAQRFGAGAEVNSRHEEVDMAAPLAKNAPRKESTSTTLRGQSENRIPLIRRVQRLTPWVYLAVPLALLITFVYIPCVNLFYYSITDWDGLTPNPSIVGLYNYRQIFTNPEYFDVFKVSLYYIAGAAVQIGLALYFAMILSFNVKFKNLWKGIIFFPYLINGVAIAFIFNFFFAPGGTLDSVLKVVGYHNQYNSNGTELAHHLWLGDPHLVNISLASVSVWRYLGLNFVLFLGAIQSIPSDLYEAAELDGASRWKQFRYIIAPSIKPILSLSVLLAIAGSLSVFEVPYIMLLGANGSATFVIQTVRTAFDFHEVGQASALAVVLLLIVLAVTWLQRLLFPDREVDLT